MAGERHDWFIESELTYMNVLVGRARSKYRIVAPINVQRRGSVVRELLRTQTGTSVPNTRRTIDTGRQNVVATLVPFQSKDRPLVPTKG